MTRKFIFGSLWLGFIVYAFFFAPPDHPDTGQLIQNLATGQWTGINPLIIALFNIMGILPMIYACFLLINRQGQKIKAFPFVLGSFAVGAFAILPYLAIRDSNSSFTGKKNRLLTLLDSRWTGIVLTLVTVGILVSGIYLGNWSDFVQQWQTSRFIHVMSLDFLILSFLFPTLVADDLSLRTAKNAQIFQLIAFIPLVGGLIYLCFRPSLTVDQTTENASLTEESTFSS
jgi:hypothetical protein